MGNVKDRSIRGKKSPKSLGVEDKDLLLLCCGDSGEIMNHSYYGHIYAIRWHPSESLQIWYMLGTPHTLEILAQYYIIAIVTMAPFSPVSITGRLMSEFLAL